MSVEHIPIDDIDIENSPEVRAFIRDETVSQYSELYSDKKTLIPIDVFRIPKSQWFLLADGKHRVLAAKKAGLKKIYSQVHEGDADECYRFALLANRTHGLPRSNEDKRTCVEQAIARWPKLSHAQVAAACDVDEKTVAKYRKELGAENNPSKVSESARTRKRQGPKVATRVISIVDNQGVTTRSGIPDSPALSTKKDKLTNSYDSMGYTIPPDVQKYWNRRGEIEQIIDNLLKIKLFLSKLGKDGKADEETKILFRGFMVNSGLADLGNVISNLQCAAPYAVCVTCKGRLEVKVNNTCDFCHGKGLLSKFQWDTCVAEEFKKHRLAVIQHERSKHES